VTLEYRVVWKREGCDRKVRRYATRSGAERFLLLFGPEPWLAYAPGCDPDKPDCCAGRKSDECGCDGMTPRQRAAATDAELPKLEWVRLEEREVGAWKVSE